MERGGRGQRRCRPEAAGLNAERPARCLALERANPSAPSPKAQCAQGAPARQEGGYQPFFPFLQPPPQRPRGRSSVGGGGAWQGLRQRVLCVGWGCRRGGLALPAPCRQGAAQAHPPCHLSRPAIRGSRPTYSVGGTRREPASHAPPRHSQEAPGGFPSPSVWGQNGERSGNGGGVRKRGGLGAGKGGGLCGEATQSPPAGRR